MAAAQTEIKKSISGQPIELLRGFGSIQDRNRSSVVSDQAGILCKIIFKITRRIIAAGGDISIHAAKNGSRLYGLGEFLIFPVQAIQDFREKPGIPGRKFHKCLVSA